MENFIKKIGWTSILTSVVFAILGMIIYFNPNTTFAIITYIIGAISIIMGIPRIITYFKAKSDYEAYNYDLISGIIAILLGIVIMICSNFIQAFLRIAIGIWILYSGAIRTGAAIRLQKLDVKASAWITVLIIAIMMIAFGLYIVAVPGSVISVIGILMIVYSVMDIIEEFMFMKTVKDIE